MHQAINIVGGPGCGCTTLGKALANKLQFRFFDGDDFYWLPSVPPFRNKRDADERNRILCEALNSGDGRFVLASSVDSWGDVVTRRLDTVIFLTAPKEVRLERIHQREVERHGQADPDFIDWASRYDEGDRPGRSKPRHESWISMLGCTVYRIDSSGSLEETLKTTLAWIYSSTG